MRKQELLLAVILQDRIADVDLRTDMAHSVSNKSIYQEAYYVGMSMSKYKPQNNSVRRIFTLGLKEYEPCEINLG